MVDEQTPIVEGGLGDELLTIEETTRFLDTSKSTIYRLLGQGDLKGVKVGKQWRFRKGDLTAYMERGPVAVAVDASARADLDAELEFFGEELARGGADAGIAEPEDTDEAKTEALTASIICLAIAANASDLHLEPAAKFLRVRLRIDGVLHEIRNMPMSLHEAVTTRFKTMAEMSLLEKRMTQDGRIAARHDGKEYDLRVSVMPTTFGENMVMRILNRSAVMLGLDRLSLDPKDRKTLEQWIHRHSGMIIATGPTGSGKTTLLYSCLQEINSPAAKIVAMEDPVECVLPGVTQVAVNRRAGMTFSAGMRSFLRQDSDVIMCGELRDIETAQIVIESSLTGHLVFTTLHTEEAPTALVRLADMGIERYLIAANVSGVVALRLARRLCEHCKTVADPDEIAPTVRKIRPVSQAGGYTIPDRAVFHGAVGCARCRNTGYLGRLGLFELLSCNSKLVGQLFQCGSSEEMTKLAVQNGMRTLFADGMSKVVAGETTIEEVVRATATWL